MNKDVNPKDKMKASVHGKTGNQIIAEAVRIKLERERKQQEQAIQEIKELEKKKTEFVGAREKLKNFKITRSRFYKRKDELTGMQLIIELSVENGTGKPISRAYFKGTLSSPKRSVPWHVDTFNYSISGGLEPGEKAKWSLAPNKFSDWGKVDAPKDAVFTVTVERLDGPEGKVLFAADQFSKRDEERLSELKEKYNIK